MGDDGYAGLELSSAGHGDGDGRAWGTYLGGGRRQKRGKRSEEETLGLGQDYIGGREQLRPSNRPECRRGGSGCPAVQGEDDEQRSGAGGLDSKG